MKKKKVIKKLTAQLEKLAICNSVLERRAYNKSSFSEAISLENKDHREHIAALQRELNEITNSYNNNIATLKMDKEDLGTQLSSLHEAYNKLFEEHSNLTTQNNNLIQKTISMKDSIDLKTERIVQLGNEVERLSNAIGETLD